MYRKGDGVPEDDKEAVKWYRLAAEQGYADAQTNLGVMYGTGQGVIKDNVYAHMWGNLAASNGDKNGGKLRDIVAKQMTPSQIETARQLARECVSKNYKGC